MENLQKAKHGPSGVGSVVQEGEQKGLGTQMGARRSHWGGEGGTWPCYQPARRKRGGNGFVRLRKQKF